MTQKEKHEKTAALVICCYLSWIARKSFSATPSLMKFFAVIKVQLKQLKRSLGSISEELVNDTAIIETLTINTQHSKWAKRQTFAFVDEEVKRIFA